MDEGRSPGSLGFGLLLRQYRLAAGLSQEALAERARMSSHGVSALERGYRRTPQRETLALLAEALKLDDPQRRALEAAAVRTGGVRRGGTAADAGSWAVAGASNLPLAVTGFVGRETELEEIAALVHGHRLVTLTGTGGVGKTQTALQVGGGLDEASDGAVCFVALAPIGDASFLVPATASALGMQALPDRAPLQTLLDYLKPRTLVLILDNCEHVIAEAAGLAGAILANCPRVRILATSREPLKVAGERNYRLPSLSEGAGIALFTDRARAADRHFELTDDNWAMIGDLCRHLDGIPLAIELAAARVSLLSVKAISERLGDRFRILTGGERTALPRQQTMRAAIDWSYDLLCESERRLFERLSVFAGGCTLATAAALYAPEGVTGDDVLEALSSLVDKSLVVADFEGHEPRYRLLESFREYAREKLAARGEEHVILQRYALECLQLAERLGQEYRSERYGLWRAMARDETYNWRAALQWAMTERCDVLLGQRIASLLPVGLMPIEGRQWVRLALELVDDRTPPGVLAGLRFAESMCAFALREFTSAIASCRLAIALYKDLGDSRRVLLAQDMAGHALVSLGRVDEAKILIEEALTIARGMDDARLLAWTLRCLGYASAKGGDLVAARGYLAEALPTYRERFSKSDLAYAVNDLGMYEFCAGSVEAALGHAIEMLALAREAHEGIRPVATALTAMSVYLVALGRYEEAEERSREALDLASEQHMEVLVAYALESLAAIAALRPRAAENAPQDAYERAARVIGWVDARLAERGSSRLITQEQQYARAVAVLRDASGDEPFGKLAAAGAGLTQDRAIEQALGH